MTTTTTIPTTGVSARTFRVFEARGRRPGRATIFSKDVGVGVGVALDDAVVSGGSLHLVSLSGAFDELVPLPANGWKRTKKGLKYRGDDGARVVLVPEKRLKVALKGPSFPLGDMAPTPIVVSLRVGGRRTCLAAAEGALNAKRGRFVAKNAAAPAMCDEGS